MTKREFLRKHKEEIDKEIKATGFSYRINNDDREQWVANKEEWYEYARSCGVRI